MIVNGGVGLQTSKIDDLELHSFGDDCFAFFLFLLFFPSCHLFPFSFVVLSTRLLLFFIFIFYFLFFYVVMNSEKPATFLSGNCMFFVA